MSIPEEEIVIVDEPAEYSHIFDRSPECLIVFRLQRSPKGSVLCLRVIADTYQQIMLLRSPKALCAGAYQQIILLPEEARALRHYLNQPEVLAYSEGR